VIPYGLLQQPFSAKAMRFFPQSGGSGSISVDP
jgi:hypothetical protein